MSSALTQHRSTALSEDWLTRRCVLMMTEGLASTQGQGPSFSQSLRQPSTTGAPRCGAG